VVSWTEKASRRVYSGNLTLRDTPALFLFLSVTRPRIVLARRKGRRKRTMIGALAEGGPYNACWRLERTDVLWVGQRRPRSDAFSFSQSPSATRGGLVGEADRCDEANVHGAARLERHVNLRPPPPSTADNARTLIGPGNPPRAARFPTYWKETLSRAPIPLENAHPKRYKESVIHPT
jgi:hypothetical protein